MTRDRLWNIALRRARTMEDLIADPLALRSLAMRRRRGDHAPFTLAGGANTFIRIVDGRSPTWTSGGLVSP